MANADVTVPHQLCLSNVLSVTSNIHKSTPKVLGMNNIFLSQIIFTVVKSFILYLGIITPNSFVSILYVSISLLYVGINNKSFLSK